MAGVLKDYRVKNKPNYDIRKRLIDSNVQQWKIADIIGINEVTLCVWLRKPLDENDPRRVKIMNALEVI